MQHGKATIFFDETGVIMLDTDVTSTTAVPHEFPGTFTLDVQDDPATEEPIGEPLPVTVTISALETFQLLVSTPKGSVTIYAGTDGIYAQANDAIPLHLITT